MWLPAAYNSVELFNNPFQDSSNLKAIIEMSIAFFQVKQKVINAQEGERQSGTEGRRVSAAEKRG